MEGAQKYDAEGLSDLKESETWGMQADLRQSYSYMILAVPYSHVRDGIP